MTPKATLCVAVCAALLGGTVAVAADGRTQLERQLGLTPAQAAELSLTELHAMKVNRDMSRADRITVSGRDYPAVGPVQHRQLARSAGLPASAAKDMSLAELAVHKYNRDTSVQDRILRVAPRAGFDVARHGQLVSAAGVPPDMAADLGLDGLARSKFNREARRDDLQGEAR